MFLSLFLILGGTLLALEDPAQHLGADLDSVFETFGTPKAVYSVRAPNPAFDDVVFVYENSVSVFWYRNRVWMLRFSPGFAGTVYGVGMGKDRREVSEELGAPDFVQDESLFYDLPFRGFPVRLRLVLDDGTVSDLYLYRSDF